LAQGRAWLNVFAAESSAFAHVELRDTPAALLTGNELGRVKVVFEVGAVRFLKEAKGVSFDALREKGWLRKHVVSMEVELVRVDLRCVAQRVGLGVRVDLARLVGRIPGSK